jgi:hypothetical protein
VPVTISGWFKQKTTSGLQPIYSGYATTTGGNLFTLIRLDGGTLHYYTSNSGGSYQGGGTFTPSVNVWHFFAVVVSGSPASPSLAIYLDGTSQSLGLGPMLATPPPVSMFIGGDASSSTEKFNGIIDEIGVWNRAISASEVSTLYRGGSGNPFGNGSCGFSH